MYTTLLLANPARETPLGMVIQAYSPASNCPSIVVDKPEQVVSSHSGEYDMSSTNSLSRRHSRAENNEDFLTLSSPEYKVYGKRWVMLFWMSLLNLLSDWTCYSVAPISVLTKQKFDGSVNPEALVTLFLAANVLATALEPTVLASLGLRRTIIFGAFLLMIGNIIKSGGIPGLTDTAIEEEQGWRIYAGFLLVGLSQPLYQCTPALFSSSWFAFADKERTLATWIALNANQVGIGLSFICGTTLVASSDDISPYFNLLSILSIIAFVGCLFQFKDAPPTPPSGSARIIRGSLEIKFPKGYKYMGQYPYQQPPSNVQGTSEHYYGYQQSLGQYQRPVAYLENSAPMIPYPRHTLPPPESAIDIDAEPTVTQVEGNPLDINIRHDQVLLSIKACFSRPGFVHAVVAFAVGGVVINTLITYMDYLVRLGGSDRTIVGIVGFFFQMLIMISGMIVGKLTDRTREYYYILLSLLVLGVWILAECGVHLDADQGVALRWSLLGAAVMVGPLQPVATELGVDVAYPLSENTVLVIQQLFSNLLSALFIPFFRYVRDVGVDADDDMSERPQYTFSLYLLILMHATAAVFFTTFNGTYARLEHEEGKNNNETLPKYVGESNEESNVYSDVRSSTRNNVLKESRVQRQTHQKSVKESYNDEEQQALIITHR